MHSGRQDIHVNRKADAAPLIFGALNVIVERQPRNLPAHPVIEAPFHAAVRIVEKLVLAIVLLVLGR